MTDIWWILNSRRMQPNDRPTAVDSLQFVLRYLSAVWKTITLQFKLASGYKTLTSDNLAHNSWERSPCRGVPFVCSPESLLFEHIWHIFDYFSFCSYVRTLHLTVSRFVFMHTYNEIQIFWSISWEIVPPATQKGKKRGLTLE